MIPGYADLLAVWVQVRLLLCMEPFVLMIRLCNCLRFRNSITALGRQEFASSKKTLMLKPGEL